MTSRWNSDDDTPKPFTLDEYDIIQTSKAHFWFFLREVFLLSFKGRTYVHDDKSRGPFEFGEIHMEWAILAQYNPRLCIMAPRAHLKTTVLALAFAMWQMFKAEDTLVDILYFSYKKDLANEKIVELRRLIEANPYCRFWEDRKVAAETLIDYFIDWGEGPIAEATMKGEGILSATRGRHPSVVICDDILSDFTNPLGSTQLRQIERVFRQAIMSLPSNPTDPLIVVGTPQSFDDVLYSIGQDEEWIWMMYPAIKDVKKKEVQWPEKFGWERLKRVRRSIGRTAFEVEYQLTPVRLADQFFTMTELANRVDIDLPLWNLDNEFPNLDSLGVYGGVDVGRQVHPSHVAVFLELPDGTLIQLYHTFMDGEKYPDQVKQLNKIGETFKITRGYYDATFNALEDRGLSRRWTGRIFTRKLKGNMATLFEKRIFAQSDEAGIVLYNDNRMLKQIATVDKDLKAVSTVEGHGDCVLPDTEVLTKGGWKFFKDLQYSDEIATLSSGDILEYQYPDNIIEQDYRGLIYHLDNQQVSLAVTPRHGMYVTKKRLSKDGFQLYTPEDIEGKSVKYKKDANWVGVEKKYIQIENHTIDMDVFLSLVGYYVSEGSRGHQTELSISQSPGWKFDIMGDTLKELPYYVKVVKDGARSGFKIKSAHLSRWITENIGHGSVNKRLPIELLELSGRQLKILLDALVLGDGSDPSWEGHIGTNYSYVTVSKRLADQVQELALKLGMSANIAVDNGNIGRKGVFGIGNYPVYKVGFIRTRNTPSVHRHGKQDYWEEYSGKVYCVTVPNHVIYVRRNGKPVWTGNSFWSTALAVMAAEDGPGLIEIGSPMTRDAALKKRQPSQTWLGQLGAGGV